MQQVLVQVHDDHRAGRWNVVRQLKRFERKLVRLLYLHREFRYLKHHH